MSLGFKLNTETKELEWISKTEAKKVDKNKIWEYRGHESFFYPFWDEEGIDLEKAIKVLKENKQSNSVYLNEFIARKLLDSEEDKTKQEKLDRI